MTSDIFEDTCSGNWPTPGVGADCDYYVIANLPQLTRDYQGFLLDVESRFTDWLHILASYVHSESKGNVEYNRNVARTSTSIPITSRTVTASCRITGSTGSR